MRNQKQSYLYKLSAQGANKLLSNLNVLYLNQYLSEYNNKGSKLQNSNMMNS
jgi:hypothetical protein